MQDRLKLLYDSHTALQILSGLMHNPLLLQNTHYSLGPNDFYQKIHEIVFSVIYNLAHEGYSQVRPLDIDSELQKSESQYEYYKRMKGPTVVETCFETFADADPKQFDHAYQRLKKFTVLRDFERGGIDTTRFYNTDALGINKDLEEEKLRNLTIDQIFNTVRTGLVTIENNNVGKDQGTSQDIGYGIRELYNSFKVHPEVGLPIEGEIVNYACSGARLGKLYTYSAPSGQGKTRYMASCAFSLSMPYLDAHNNIVVRGTPDHYDFQKVLFITTEQKADEIQTLLMAYVSGVNENHIIKHTLTPEEEEKVELALQIIETFGGNVKVETMSDPSIEMIKAKLVSYIVTQGFSYIFYDYIFSSPGLLNEFKDVGVREDVALMMLSNTLKEIAATYNVFVQSATQLNDGWAKKEIGARDQNCIRGSKAIADKIDVGLIGVRINEEEKKQVQPLWDELHKKNPAKYAHEPNIVVDIYKNRRGDMSGCKVFRWFDYSTMHCEDLFATDSGYRPITSDRCEYDTFKLSSPSELRKEQA